MSPTDPNTRHRTTPISTTQRDLDRERAALQTFLEKTVRDVTAHKASWPFLVCMLVCVCMDALGAGGDGWNVGRGCTRFVYRSD